MTTPRQRKTLAVKDPRQRRALASPLRQEILSQWTDGTPRSVADIAAAMGRPATAIYYHVHRLEDVGLLTRIGSRQGARRDEVLYRPVARQFDLTPTPGDTEQTADAVAALTAAHRMALGDLKEALESGGARFDGPDRNLLAFRLHGRLSRDDRARANALLDELLAMFEHAPASTKDAGAEFCSLTVALAPLRGREQEGGS